MSADEVFEVLEELQEELDAIERLASKLEVEPPDDCERCGNTLAERYGRLDFKPISHELDQRYVHVCTDCIGDATALLDRWLSYDRRYLVAVAFGSESWKNTRCSWCQSGISDKPTIVSFERVTPDGFANPFAGDFLSCEHCREKLVQKVTRSEEGVDE